MKPVGQVKKQYGLTDTQLNNFRRDQYLHPVKRGGEYQYSQRDCLALQHAVPEWRQGIKPCIAFPRAEAHYEKIVEAIFESVAEYTEAHNGYSPTAKWIESELSHIGAVADYVEAIVEEQRLVRDGGHLRIVPVYKAPPGLLAYKTNLSNPSWWRVLSEEKRLALQDLAFGIYFSATRQLPDDHKIPAPVDSLMLSEGFTVAYRNLGTDESKGYNDPVEKVLYLSNQIRKNRERSRLILMHEYFHVRLKHSECSNNDQDHREAEATYAAVHYLLPMHSFEATARRCIDSHQSFQAWMKKIARVYQLPLDVLIEYYHETLWRQSVIQPPHNEPPKLVDPLE